MAEKGTMESLLADLEKAADKNPQQRECQVCRNLRDMPADAVREATIRALEPSGHGSIGGKTLAKILTSNGYPTGERAIARHRREAHTQ